MGLQFQPPPKHFEKLFPLTKIDSTNQTVGGVIADESKDKSGESMDYEASLPYFKKWSGEIASATGGKSVGNVREMHGLTAVGKLIDLQYDDANKRIIGTAKIIDPLCWKKCLDGVLTGYSIGGSYLGGLKTEKAADGSSVKRYVAVPSEVSVVDLPCNSNAHFEFVKADGTIELRKFAHATDEEVNMTKEEVETLVKNTIASSMQEILEKGGSGSGKKPFTEQQGSPDKAVQDSEQILFHPQTGLCPKCNKGAGECKCTMKATTNDSEQILLNPSLTQQEKAVGGICPKCQKETEKCECAAKVAAGPCPKCGLAKEKCACKGMAAASKKKPSPEKMAHAVTVVFAKTLEKFYNLTSEQVEKVFEGSMRIAEEMSKGGPGSGRHPAGFTAGVASLESNPARMEGAGETTQAVNATKTALESGSAKDHLKAASEHQQAAWAHEGYTDAAGENSKLGQAHIEMMNAHNALSQMHHKAAAGLKTVGVVDKAVETNFYKVFTDEVEPQPMKKGMNAVSRLAQFLLDIAWLKWSVEQEEAAEGDENSPLPAKLQEDLAGMAETLMEMAGEETKELVTMLAEGKSPYETGLTPQGSPSFCGPLTTSCPVPFYRASEPDDLQKADFDPTLGYGGDVEGQPPFYQMTDEAQEDPFLVAGGEHEPTDSDGYDGYETTQPLLPLPVFFSNLEDEDTGGLYMSSVDVPHGSLTNA